MACDLARMRIKPGEATSVHDRGFQSPSGHRAYYGNARHWQRISEIVTVSELASKRLLRGTAASAKKQESPLAAGFLAFRDTHATLAGLRG
jgi:hypothetical protein